MERLPCRCRLRKRREMPKRWSPEHQVPPVLPSFPTEATLTCLHSLKASLPIFTSLIPMTAYILDISWLSTRPRAHQGTMLPEIGVRWEAAVDSQTGCQMAFFPLQRDAFQLSMKALKMLSKGIPILYGQ
jgi:hypothetical protein